VRQVPRKEVQAYVQEAELLFFDTSAKTGEVVVEVFTDIGMSSSSYSKWTHSHFLGCGEQQRIFL
jgi:hypothetical protein